MGTSRAIRRLQWSRCLSRVAQEGRLRPDQPQLFCVGFHKTGTTSLSSALEILGYRAVHGDGRKHWSGGDEGRTFIQQIESGDFNLATLPLFDAFLDNPYFSIWRQLADAHPDSKFILTERDTESWINSCVRYYHGRPARPMREWMFGAHSNPSLNPEAKQTWITAYKRHNRAVRNHFSDSKNFLALDFTKGQGWSELCTFLGDDVPSNPFPFRNKSTR